MRSAVVALAFVTGGCVTVTRAQNLETDAARAWVSEAADQRITVDAPGDVPMTGRIAAISGQTVTLRGDDGGAFAIPVKAGTTLRERNRVRGALLGGIVGTAIGLVIGALVYETLSSPNPDSAGGREHPPAVVIPLGLLAGAAIGMIIGVAVGTERSLEVR